MCRINDMIKLKYRRRTKLPINDYVILQCCTTINEKIKNNMKKIRLIEFV